MYTTLGAGVGFAVGPVGPGLEVGAFVSEHVIMQTWSDVPFPGVVFSHVSVALLHRYVEPSFVQLALHWSSGTPSPGAAGRHVKATGSQVYPTRHFSVE